MVTKNGVLTTTIPSNADLIIGQTVPLMVTLTTNGAINTQNVNITFTGASPNISVPAGNLTLKDMGNNAYVYITELVVSSDPNVIKEHDSIQFTITVNGSNAAPFVFTGTARTINPDTLPLMLSDMFLDTPNRNPSQPVKGAMATTLLRDKKAIPLGNTPVFIRSQIPENLSYCKILDSDNKTEIPIQKIGDYSGVSVNSDKDGNIKFYIYPQKADSMVLELQSWIANVDKPVAASSPLFIVNTEIPKFPDGLLPPNILGGFPGPLTSEGGESDFYIAIPKYSPAKPDDYIVFFTKNLEKPGAKREYSGHYVIVGNPEAELGASNYFYKLPYDIFEYNVPSDINYVVILGEAAGSLTSQSTNVTYMGGATYYPLENVTRNYDTCKVYTSLGAGVVEIPEGTYINYDGIKRYLDNNNPVNTGLFIEILGGDNIPGKIPLGYNVKINMYIDTTSYSTKKQWLYPMPTQVNTDGIAILQFHIPKDILVGFEGRIYFDYELSIENKKQYGKIWEGLISTQPE
ncbi:conserved protein of unknown function [Xenorhabdus poinarii G6]|uniref:Uncharacterized protein n=1 Tax=Xenorhabdus poinarii G6 TaxID=1354304 RepID=A0A068QXT6_9GAMM|nr:hypothetical protein [Xenorhabdus poinarii]CDG19827.1 conserved protein of unknown function [Xenorhabdus poinarii G6]